MYDLDENVNQCQQQFASNGTEYNKYSYGNDNVINGKQMSSNLRQIECDYSQISMNPEKSVSSTFSAPTVNQKGQKKPMSSLCNAHQPCEIYKHAEEHWCEEVRRNCNALQNHSEAGPDIACYIKEEFNTSLDCLKLGQPGALKSVCPSLIGFSKDIVTHLPSNSAERVKTLIPTMEGSDNKEISSQSLLINFSPSPAKQEHSTYTEGALMEAKKQDFMFYEKSFMKDKEQNEIVRNWDKEKQVLKNQIVAIHSVTRTSMGLLEELLKVMQSFMVAREQERVKSTNDNQKLLEERDLALEDLKSVENAFTGLHNRYENCKNVLTGYKEREEYLKQQISEMQTKLKQQEQMFEMVRTRIQEKLDSANSEIEGARKSGEAELAVLRAQLKKSEMKTSSLEREVEQKSRENAELTNICDELISKVQKS